MNWAAVAAIYKFEMSRFFMLLLIVTSRLGPRLKLMLRWRPRLRLTPTPATRAWNHRTSHQTSRRPCRSGRPDWWAR